MKHLYLHLSFDGLTNRYRILGMYKNTCMKRESGGLSAKKIQDFNTYFPLFLAFLVLRTAANTTYGSENW